MSALPRAICHECGRSIAVRNGGELREHKPLEGYEATCHDTKPCPGSGTAPPELETIAGHPVHPAASAWPLMSEEDLAELAADIKANGLRESIRMRGDLVLDGRNRLLACQAAGVGPRFERAWAGDAVAFVVSANLHRRHLTTSQRAMLAARMADHRRGLPIGRAADLLKVGERSVHRAREVLESGDAELAAQVDRGELAVSAAAEQVRAPEITEEYIRELLQQRRQRDEAMPGPYMMGRAARSNTGEALGEWGFGDREPIIYERGSVPWHQWRIGWTDADEMIRDGLAKGYIVAVDTDTDIPQYTDADGDLSSPRRETGREARERRARGELAPGWPPVAGEQDDAADDALPDGERAPWDAYWTPALTVTACLQWLQERVLHIAPHDDHWCDGMTAIEPSVGGGGWVHGLHEVLGMTVDRVDIDAEAPGGTNDLRDAEDTVVADWLEPLPPLRDEAARLGLRRRRWRLCAGNRPYSGDIRPWVELCLERAEVVALLERETITGTEGRLPWWNEHRPMFVAKVVPRPKWEGPGARPTTDRADSVLIVWVRGYDGPTFFDWIDASESS